MDGRRTKFILIGLGIVATMIFMLVVATQKSDGGFAYYVTVKEYTEKGQPKGRFRSWYSRTNRRRASFAAA